MLEETGLHIHNVQFGHVTNDIMIDESKHYVTIFMMSECKCPMGRPLNLEPHKCEGWNSYSWEELCQFVANSNGTNNNDNLHGRLWSLRCKNSSIYRALSEIRLYTDHPYTNEMRNHELMPFFGIFFHRRVE